MNRDDGDKRGRVRVVDAPPQRALPLSPAWPAGRVAILDAYRPPESIRFPTAPAPASIEYRSADLGRIESVIFVPNVPRSSRKLGRSTRVEYQRNRRRRQALQRLERRAARRARRVAHIVDLLHQLAEHDAREPSPGWQDAVLAAITAQETP